MSDFVDRTRLVVRAGGGGRGAISFRREAHVPRGGPDGGDGGRGGDVLIRVDGNTTTLSEFRHLRVARAPSGEGGSGKNRSGAAGRALLLRIPAGTVVRDLDSGQTIADLLTEGEELVAARGGRGGRGNARFVSSTRRAPRIAEDGEPGEERRIELELKLIADVGLVGLPNAGKSSLLAALTRANPKIAAYPFTTLVPNLGVARFDDRELVVADIPGLIEGAHEGAGLGEEFLRHIERTRLLVHVIDAATPDPEADRAVVEREMAAYGRGLADLPRLLALNKIDLPEARAAADALAFRFEVRAFPVSAATGEGVGALAAGIFGACPPRPAATTTEPVRKIAFAATGRDWRVEREGEGFRIRGARIEALASGVDWEDPGASAYVHRVLVRTGIEKALREAGVREGDTVRIGKAELEWTEGGT